MMSLKRLICFSSMSFLSWLVGALRRSRTFTPCGLGILSPLCLPFHHQGKADPFWTVAIRVPLSDSPWLESRKSVPDSLRDSIVPYYPGPVKHFQCVSAQFLPTLYSPSRGHRSPRATPAAWIAETPNSPTISPNCLGTSSCHSSWTLSNIL